MSDSNKQSGFTITELLIGISVASIIFIVLLGVITNYLYLITRTNASIDMTNSSQNLLRSTVEALRLGDGVQQTNSIADSHSPVGGWNTSNSNFVIVIETPAYDSSRNFIVDSSTGNPYMNELIYYKSGNSLMRRSLANPSATGNVLRTSCPAASASASCPADVDLADYFQSMDFTLYDENGTLVTDPADARSIKINLQMQRVIFGKTISLNNSIRVTLRNKF